MIGKRGYASRVHNVTLLLVAASPGACSSNEGVAARRIDGGALDGSSWSPGGGTGSGGTANSGGSSASGGSAGAGGSGAGSGGAPASGGAAGTPDAGPFVPNGKLADLADETALDLGQFQCDAVEGEDVDLCRRATDYGGFVYDPHHHQMLLFGGGHSTTMTDSVHAFDLGDTLKWRDLYAPTPCASMTAGNLDANNGAWLAGPSGPYPRPVSSHTYDMLAVAPLLDEFIVISRNFTGGYCNPVGNDIGGKVAHFALGAGTWSFSPTAEGSGGDLAVKLPGSEADPVSGKIVLFGSSGLSLYDPATRTATHVADTLNDSGGSPVDVSGTGYANHVVYFPPEDRFYLVPRNTPTDLYALTLDRANPTNSTIERVTASGTTSPHGEPGYDYDSRNHVIGGGVQDSTFYALDPATQTWSSHPMNGGTPGNQAFHSLAYDPVDNVFVFVTEGAHTWAYRLKR